MGVGRGEEKDEESLDFTKQFLPRLVKLALEGIDGRNGYNRRGEPVPIFYDSY